MLRWRLPTGWATCTFQNSACPRQIRHEYRENQDWKKYTVRFKAHLKDQKEVLGELAQLAGETRICLLCFEEDFNFCHRTYVGEALAGFIPGNVCLFHLTGPMQGRVVRNGEGVGGVGGYTTPTISHRFGYRCIVPIRNSSFRDFEEFAFDSILEALSASSGR